MALVSTGSISPQPARARTETVEASTVRARRRREPASCFGRAGSSGVAVDITKSLLREVRGTARHGRRRAHAAGKKGLRDVHRDRKSTRLNSSHVAISYAVFCL